MRARIIQLLLLASLALVLAGCGLQPLPYAVTPIPTLIPATLPAAAPVAAGGTPVGETLVVETPAAGESVGDVAAGETVFNTYCTACHKLTNETLVGPGLAGLFERDVLPNGNTVTDENVQGWIRTGGGAMPGFALGDTEMNDLLAFLHDRVG